MYRSPFLLSTSLLLLVTSILATAWGSEATKPAVAPTEVLTIRDGRFELGGKPFAEISFNKFDLVWQLYDAALAGKAIDDQATIVKAQDRALGELTQLGFRTIRVFGLPWGPNGPISYSDPKRRAILYRAIDKALDLCDRHGLKVVWSLACATFTDAHWTPDHRVAQGKEHLRELIADPKSQGRQLMNRYVDETVERYKNRSAILMWEISNESTLHADIGDNQGIHDGMRVPTLDQIAVFWRDVTSRIKAIDPLRLVNSGGSSLREQQWNRWKHQGWKLDTLAQQQEALDLLYAKGGPDVVDIHWYPSPSLHLRVSDGAKGTTALGLGEYHAMAKRVKLPFMVGEVGLKAMVRDPKNATNQDFWRTYPTYFASLSEPQAEPWVRDMLQTVIEAQVPLSYWWAYSSDRAMDQNDPQRWDITLERNPKLVQLVATANRQLQKRLTEMAFSENNK